MKKVIGTVLLMLILGTTVVFAQKNLTVKGMVKDKDGHEALIGVSVLVKGTTIGTITNIDGQYQLSNVAENATLIFSYVGMKSESVAVGGRIMIDVKLDDEQKSLEEVVVVGYGTKKAGAITGSVVQIKSAEILKTPAQSPLQSIQGKAAGVNIVATDEPGKAPTVMIRGINTVLGGRTPLYVIDGVEATSLNGLSSNDIATIDILKDASSLAIYGNKAANGVILVTTKKGTKGATKITYDGYMSAKSMLKTIEMADSYRFAYYQNFATGRSKFSQSQPYNTNWLKEITQTGIVSNHALALSGGGENANYYLGVSLYSEKGILKGTDYNRTNIINKNDYKLLNDRLKITNTFNLSVTNSTPKPISAFTAAYKQAPMMPVKYDDGKWGMPFVDGTTGQITESGDKFNNVPNPVAMLDYNVDQNNNVTLGGTLGAELQISKSLKFNSNFGSTFDRGKGYTYTPNELNWFSQNPTATEFPNKYYSTLTQRRSGFFVWNWDNYLNYTTQINSHSISAVLGMTRSTSRTGEYLSATRYNVPPQSNYWSLDLSKNDYKVAPGTVISNSNETPLISLGYFARFDYDYAKKYLLTASIRRDGISDFQSSQKWGTFPAISGGWVMSSEPFFEPLNSLVDYAKIRLGYGEIGNGNACPSVNQVLFQNGATYPFGTTETIYPGSYVPYAVDPNLTWETTKEFDAGIDLRLLRQRLIISLDLYRRNTDHVILPVKLPTVLSPDAVYLNAGVVQNKGIEGIFSWADKIGKSLKYHAGFNFAVNKNAITEIYSPYFDKLTGGDLGNGYYTKEIHVGDPIGSFYVYQTTGYTVDGKFTYSDSRVYAGSYIPTLTYGFNFGFEYRNFDFSTDWYGVAGNKVYNGKKAQRWGGENIEKSELTDFWLPSNPRQDATNPRPFADTPIASTYYIESGAFLRINNITLGYTFPTNYKFVRKLRVFATATNPLIFTKYSGFSPELSGSDNGNPLSSAGIELDAYPTNRSFSFGISLGI